MNDVYLDHVTIDPGVRLKTEEMRSLMGKIHRTLSQASQPPGTIFRIRASLVELAAAALALHAEVDAPDPVGDLADALGDLTFALAPPEIDDEALEPGSTAALAVYHSRPEVRRAVGLSQRYRRPE